MFQKCLRLNQRKDDLNRNSIKSKECECMNVVEAQVKGNL